MSGNPQVDRESCYFCHDNHTELLETHHIVPSRYGGSDDAENLVDVCPNCHQKLERLYGNRFYEKLGIEVPDAEVDEQEFTVKQRYTCREQITERISDHVAETGNAQPEQELITDLVSEGYSREVVSKELEKLKQRGDVYDEFDGGLKTT